ncbi:hypothetical protein [Aureimonas phyllosphaerae]|uniref:Uncharacterized protein n=1 Tax=Aureimonas phyllosphaerae TaxID=1166078 RepID=A0A7W6BTS8_9HYPH|nr:hypothetical protein [Aureimonas phyllosphaerae]MBB3937898.1 hypothetical protein [Aureimonas phyllosphaerae]MBB3961929.1 hypothetical protein [Aureimonas phyllosphaerae]SFF54766.1 hypothetical protein SAMN05216566_12556 [Aureimonas phyllosphaerae]
MTRHLTERQRAEQVIFIDQLAHVVEVGASDPTDAEVRVVLARLAEARRDTIAGLLWSEQQQLSRRVLRADIEAFAPARRVNAPVAGFGLALYCLLRRLIDAAYLVIGDGSPLDQATTTILVSLEDYASRPGAMDRAERDADAIAATLRASGYLQGLDAPTDA